MYAVGPDDFVAERERLSRELRDAGQKEEAKVVKAARKPTLSAWTVNQLARQERRNVDLLLDASHRLREAQQGLLAGKDERGFEEARRTQRDALAALRKAADRILSDAGRGGETTLNKVTATLQAAAVSDEGRELLARGRLTGDVEPTGFELLSPLSAGPPAKTRPTGPAKKQPASAPSKVERRRQDRERLDAARGELRDARAAAKEANAELRAAEKDAEKAERELARAEKRVHEKQAAAAQAQEAVSEAEDRLRAAQSKR